MTAFDTAFETVTTLVERFSKGIHHYSSPVYQESEARQDFIDDFFTALGWDVRHREQQNPYEQEVKIERSQKQQEAKAQKRADYAFYLRPNFKNEMFFAEAKKPSVGLKNPDHYFQTIRYGWSANTPVAILTDFEEFHILDCRLKPDIRYIFNGYHKEYRFKDYLDKDKFAEIYWLFSREAVANESLQKYSRSLPKPRGRAIQKTEKGAFKPIDDDFLEYIDGLREKLAKAFKKNDNSLNGEELTEATQRTIDRLVFIRFLEDKLIEPENHVSEWASWKDFVSDCRRLDAKYNGIVFKKHFIDEQNFSGPEEKMFVQICGEISNINSPYQFNYLPIHILGSIYERFLGKIVTSTAHRITIEEKPEVRKAGGVYYTPKYIVDHIVKNTVGKIINNKSPKEIAKLRFADIACGSGSFLIGIYAVLLDYHIKYYNEKLKDKTEIDGRSEDFGNTIYKDGQWTITLKLKQEILLNNIYGIDIDSQAVEVTQLSLFLKMLEDETLSSTQIRQGSMFSKVLPDLTKNIVCGNSLIGFDIMNGHLFEDHILKKLNPMDYETVFPSIMRDGGFDVIVGNPPYGRILSDEGLNYVSEYAPSIKTVGDVYIAFMVKATKVLKPNGMLSYIVPSSWLGGVAYKSLRIEIGNLKLIEILSLPFDVFRDAYVDTTIFILANQKADESHKVTCFSYPKKVKLEEINVPEDEWNMIPLKSWLNSPEKKFILSEGIWNVYSKLKQTMSTTVGTYLEMKRGVLFDLNLLTATKTSVKSYPYFQGDVYRYVINESMPMWIEYGSKMKEYPKEFRWFENERILMRRLVNRQQRLMSSYTDKTFVTNKNLYSLLPKESTANKIFLLAALGILNSKLISKLYIEQVSQATKDDFPQVTIKDILGLPMPEIDEKGLLTISSLVSQILDAKLQSHRAKTDSERAFMDKKCAALERQIDECVYHLYQLSNEEIEIIEK